MKFKTLRKGQSTLEYAIIIVVVVGALIAMQWYIKGGYQGKLKQASDEMGEQFSPTLTTGTITTTHNSNTNEATGGGSFAGGTMSSTTTTYDQSQTRNGQETTAALTPIAGDQR